MTGDISRVIRLPDQPTLDTMALSHVPIPQPGPDDVLMRVRATSLNFHDYLVVGGFIPVPAGRVPMSDGAGEIVALGAHVTGFAVGDRVMGAFFPDWVDGIPTDLNNARISGETTDGFAAEHVVIPAHSLTPMPKGWSFAEAATLPCAGLTAWRALVVEGDLAAGDTVLLPGSGGLSVYALQIAKALGLTAIVTSSSDEKLKRLAALGADQGINYRTDPAWGKAVRALTKGIGADLVIEIGGQSSFAQSVTACRMGGRIMVVGSTANGAPELPLRDVVMHHIRVNGMAVGSVSQLRNLVSFVETHAIHPIIDRAFAIDQLAEAFRYQLTGAHLGKIAVTL
ncbi:zinc-dependent alcohol dehydrogenase family protein [Sphingobium boeckii]|uniref:NADPH:quinone reductase-like Zn-dependent oxidoreductase n=1 Tax=Sphingobium boeckii TaxID=1082345 RepID=A0A7W9EE53_9SPHN|nr:NAD(P)-dependent alcohol dehydrogenase [Sphingobium boeckii]MBB5685908.1 NADPH:quinone reductase-like Zn-dependent oxidoreductase [Sphingobium boeckii]